VNYNYYVYMRVSTALKTRKDAELEQWERALKKATERAGEGNRPKILDEDFL